MGINTENLELNPLEQALSLFAWDYMSRKLTYDEMIKIAADLLEKDEESMYIFMDCIDNFAGENTILKSETKSSQHIEEHLSTHGICVQRRNRYMPPSKLTHNFIKILVVYGGNCTLVYKDMDMYIMDGDICIIAPNTAHNIFCHGDEQIMLEIALRPNAFNDLFFGTIPNDEVLARFFMDIAYKQNADMVLLYKSGNDEAVRSHIRSVFDEYTPDIPIQMRIATSHLSLALFLLQRDYADTAVGINWNDAPSHDIVGRILRYIRSNCATATLSNVSKEFHFSEGYLSRLIKKSTGLTFSVFLRNLRMERAAIILQDKDATVIAAMEAVGYSNPANFSRRFKEYHGKSPSDFRNFS